MTSNEKNGAVSSVSFIHPLYFRKNVTCALLTLFLIHEY